MIVSEKKEEFYFSISNDVAGVQISNTMDILEIISDFRSYPFTLINIGLPVNSYMIACTNTQNFEKGENCASTISVDHTFGSDMNLFGYDVILFGYYLILFGSIFKFQESLFMHVPGLINFGVTNQVPQVSSKLATGDLMLASSYEFYDIIFCDSLVIF